MHAVLLNLLAMIDGDGMRGTPYNRTPQPLVQRNDITLRKLNSVSITLMNNPISQSSVDIKLLWLPILRPFVLAMNSLLCVF